MRDINEIFAERTCYKFLASPIPDVLLQEIYDIVKLGPTAANSCPLRILFVKTADSKEKLYKSLFPNNVDKVKSAPVTAIFAYDKKFYEFMHELSPHDDSLMKYFASSEPASLDAAFRNSTLQAAYFIVTARSKGLDCGPMSGFNKEIINESFFKDSSWAVNFICNLGYRAGPNPYPRLPRLSFDQACKII